MYDGNDVLNFVLWLQEKSTVWIKNKMESSLNIRNLSGAKFIALASG